MTLPTRSGGAPEPPGTSAALPACKNDHPITRSVHAVTFSRSPLTLIRGLGESTLVVCSVQADGLVAGERDSLPIPVECALLS